MKEEMSLTSKHFSKIAISKLKYSKIITFGSDKFHFVFDDNS